MTPSTRWFLIPVCAALLLVSACAFRSPFIFEIPVEAGLGGPKEGADCVVRYIDKSTGEVVTIEGETGSPNFLFFIIEQDDEEIWIPQDSIVTIEVPRGWGHHNGHHDDDDDD